MTSLHSGVLVLDPTQPIAEAGLVCLALEYRLWLVDPDGGASVTECQRREAGTFN